MANRGEYALLQGHRLKSETSLVAKTLSNFSVSAAASRHACCIDHKDNVHVALACQ